MKKAILSAFGALSSTFCMIISLRLFASKLDADYALFAVLFGFGIIASIGFGIEDTKLADKLSNLFKEEVSHE